ncbi:hypothetical protein BHM03_00018730 [Ensete ventricosum]|nr:hypothetical protein BHM03_00018730 [Ensete ventricosum]
MDKHSMDAGKYVRYTAEQVEALERVYAECPKPSSTRRQQLIRECPILANIEPKQIKVWFQNRRCREKQRKETSRLQAVNRKLTAMNKLLMEENERLQKQVTQLVHENAYMRQQLQNFLSKATGTAIAEIIKDRPAWFHDCRNLEVFTMFPTGNGGTIELVLFFFCFVCSTLKLGPICFGTDVCSDYISSCTGLLDPKAWSVPEVLRPLYESSRVVAQKMTIASVPPALLVRFLREHRSEWADYNVDAYSAASLKAGVSSFSGSRPTRFSGSQIIMPLAHTVENEEVHLLVLYLFTCS